MGQTHSPNQKVIVTVDGFKFPSAETGVNLWLMKTAKRLRAWHTYDARKKAKASLISSQATSVLSVTPVDKASDKTTISD